MKSKVIALFIVTIGLIVNTSCNLLWQVDNTVDIEFTLSKEALLQAKTASALRTIGGDDSSENRRDEATISLHYETNDKLIAANQVFLVDDNDITISFNDLEIVGKGVYAQIAATIDGVDYIGRSESKIMVTAINILEIDGMREATMQVETPEIFAGEYVSATSEWPITITCETPDAGILYSLSSNNHSTQYPYIKEFPVSVKDGDVTIRAYATKPEMKDSETTEKVLSKLVLEKLATPKIYHDGNELEQDAKIDFSKGLTFDSDTDDVIYSYKFSRDPDFTEISYPDPSVKNPVAIPSNATSIRVKANKTGYIESDEIEVWFEQAQVEAPSIVTVGEANAQGEKQIEISSNTDDAIIYYTTDATEPQTSVGGSTKLYENAFLLPVMDENKTVKAIAVKVGYKDSLVTTQPISQVGAIEVPTVRYSGNILSEGSELDFSQGLTFENNTTGATISYKWNDGSFIEIGNGANTGAIPSGTTSVTFKAEMNGSVPSPDNTVHFTQAQVGAPWLSRSSSEISFDTEITVDSSTNNVQFYYTLDGSNPTISSDSTSGNISLLSVVGDSVTVKVMAVRTGYINSAITTETYTKRAVGEPSIEYDYNTLQNGTALDFSKGLTFYSANATRYAYTFYYAGGLTEIESGNGSSVARIPDNSASVKVIASAEGYKDSEITVTFAQLQAAAPRVLYNGSELVDNQAIRFSMGLEFESDTDGSEFVFAFYNGATVTKTDTVDRETGIIIEGSSLVVVITRKDGYLDSSQVAINFTPIAKSNTIFLNGQTGSDFHVGDIPGQPVKTFETAISSLNEGGTIWINGTVDVSTDQTWAKPATWSGNSELIVKRYCAIENSNVGIDFVENLINVTANTLTLTNITIDGQGGITYDGIGHGNVISEASLIMVQSGATLNLDNKATLQNVNMAHDSETFDGGALYVNGTVNIKDGSKIEYNEGAHRGGAIFIMNGNVVMETGSLIQNNKAGFGGGAIAIDRGELTMNGGLIDNHRTDYSSAGVWILPNGTFIMKGGTISNNHAANFASGIAVDGTLQLSGNPVVKGNTSGDMRIPSNIYFENMQDTSPVSFSGNITGTTPASIGLSPTTTNSGAMLVENTGGHDFNISYFTMDNTSIAPLPSKVDNNLKLVSPTEVFLDGSLADDTGNDGLSQGSPVNTFEEAKAIINNSGLPGTIWVTGKVFLTRYGDHEIVWESDANMPITVKRHVSFTSVLLEIAGVQLTLRNITIDGNKDAFSTPRATSLVFLRYHAEVGDETNHGALILESGSILQNNDASEGYQGGAVSVGTGGELTMHDGAIIQNNAAMEGGGVHITDGIFNMRGGIIQNNLAYYDGSSIGGGVYIQDGYNVPSEMYVNGKPQIINNYINGSFVDGKATGTLNNVEYTNLSSDTIFNMDGPLTDGTSIGLTPSTTGSGSMLIINPGLYYFEASYFTMDDTSLSAPVKVGDDLKMP